MRPCCNSRAAFGRCCPGKKPYSPARIRGSDPALLRKKSCIPQPLPCLRTFRSTAAKRDIGPSAVNVVNMQRVVARAE
jgi:hypothetical protein